MECEDSVGDDVGEFVFADGVALNDVGVEVAAGEELARCCVISGTSSWPCSALVEVAAAARVDPRPAQGCTARLFGCFGDGGDERREAGARYREATAGGVHEPVDDGGEDFVWGEPGTESPDFVAESTVHRGCVVLKFRVVECQAELSYGVEV